MTEERPAEVLTRDLSSGKVHKRFWVDNRYVVDERCNLDQAGDYEVIATLANIEEDRFCGHCFPPLVPEVDSAL